MPRALNSEQKMRYFFPVPKQRFAVLEISIFVRVGPCVAIKKVKKLTEIYQVYRLLCRQFVAFACHSPE